MIRLSGAPGSQHKPSYMNRPIPAQATVGRSGLVLFQGSNIPTIMTPSDYRHLDSAQKLLLRQQNIPLFAQTYIFDRLVGLAGQFARQYPENRFDIYGFGRTPLVFMEILKAMKEGLPNCQFFAGSGFKDLARELEQYGFVKNQDQTGLSKDLHALLVDNPSIFQEWMAQENAQGRMSPERRNFAMNIRQNLLAYKDYLKIKGLDPESIVERARQGKNTVIMDGIHGGGAIDVLGAILCLWARETHQEKAVKHALVFHLFAPTGLSQAHENLARFKKMGWQYVLDEKNSGYFWELMANDSYGLGVQLRYNQAVSYPQAIEAEAENSRSDTASIIRYIIMNYLDQANLLR